MKSLILCAFAAISTMVSASAFADGEPADTSTRGTPEMVHQGGRGLPAHHDDRRALSPKEKAARLVRGAPRHAHKAEPAHQLPAVARVLDHRAEKEVHHRHKAARKGGPPALQRAEKARHSAAPTPHAGAEK